MKRILLISLCFIQTLISYSQTVLDNLTWVSGNSVTAASSPSFNFCNGQITYSISSSIGFKNVSTAGNPNYTSGMITPGYIYDPSSIIPITIAFSQPVCNLRIRFCDLDGGQNEYLSAISTPYTGLSDVIGHFSGNGTQVNSSIDDARGWVEWSGPITNLSFNYNRPGPGCGLIIDSILFECCTSPCQPPNPGTNNTLNICSQGAAMDLFPLLGPGAATNGTWTNPAGNVVIMPYDPLNMDAGAYMYTVDSSGCDSSAVITVNEFIPDVTVITTDVTCHGMSNGSATLNATNVVEYSLNGAPNVPIPTPFVLNGLTAGTYQLVVYTVDGCSKTRSFTILEPSSTPPLISSVSPDTEVCSGVSSTITAAGSGGSLPYTFTWFSGNGIVGTDSTITVTTNQTTEYGVILTEACGLVSDTVYVTIVVPQPLIPILVPNDSGGCSPHPVVFSNNTGFPGNVLTSTINFGDGTPLVTSNGLDGCSHTYEAPGTYSVSITSVSTIGCMYTNTFTNMISVSGPDADFMISPNPVTIFNTNVALVNSSTGTSVDYSWSIPGGTPSTSSLEDVAVDFPRGVAGNYEVTLIVTDSNGCVDSVTKIVQVLSDVIIYAPNTFTPDGDEFNQTWFLYIDGIDIYQFNLKVFNRWGEVIWESNDPNGSWDGTYQGAIVPNGQYNWILETREMVSDKKYTFDGHINVLR